MANKIMMMMVRMMMMYVGKWSQVRGLYLSSDRCGVFCPHKSLGMNGALPTYCELWCCFWVMKLKFGKCTGSYFS